jgi:hypothetical protein
MGRMPTPEEAHQRLRERQGDSLGERWVPLKDIVAIAGDD